MTTIGPRPTSFYWMRLTVTDLELQAVEMFSTESQKHIPIVSIWDVKTRAPQAGQYTPVHQFRKKINRNPLIALLNGGTIWLKWTKSFSF